MDNKEVALPISVRLKSIFLLTFFLDSEVNLYLLLTSEVSVPSVSLR